MDVGDSLESLKRLESLRSQLPPAEPVSTRITSLSRQTRVVLAGPVNQPHSAALVLKEPSPTEPVAFGRYELIRRIGAGGMGEVFLAREPSPLGPRACVLKKVLPSLQENRAFVGRFLDEARVVVKLKHPNIARVYAMGDVAGEYFLTMEYVQGKTVSRFMRRLRERKKQLSVGLALFLGERVCEGLQYAHDAVDENGAPLQLVHRDLSPANVCISYRGEVKIIDFGAAQSTLKEEQTAPRVVIGNLTYMAPEQAKKQLVDRRADVYSCGVMLWELLAWHALPQKGDPIERWRKAANPSWEAPSLYHGRIPPEVDAVILKALDKEPTRRFASAAELGQALKRVREAIAPEASEKELGALLSEAFDKEKASEDEVLRESIGTPIDTTPTDRTKRLNFVPPTALAFEHTAVLADFVPPDDTPAAKPQLADAAAPTIRASGPRHEVTVTADEGTPTPAVNPRKHRVNERRTSFGVTFQEATEPRIEPSLIQEIEALEPYEQTAPDAERPPSYRGLFLFAGVFLAAMGAGFLAILLWASR